MINANTGTCSPGRGASAARIATIRAARAWWLCQPLHTPGDLVEQLASRQELVTNQAFMSAATALYVDAATQQPKRGARGKTRGTARRLADICNQLDVTWDLYAMNAGELLGKLPREFQRFQPAP